MRSLNLIFLIGVALVLSCDDRDLPRRSVGVEIYRTDISARGVTGQLVQIEAGMAAINGCYSDLAIEMIKIDASHFVLKGRAVFSTNGFCPEMMVYQDTILYFRPTLAGEYFFQVNEAPFGVRRDTLLVD